MRIRTVMAATLIAASTVACGSDDPDPQSDARDPFVRLDEGGSSPSPSAGPGTRGVPPGTDDAVPPLGSSAAPAGQPARPNDGGDVGSNAFLYLNRRVPKLVVEVDAVRGSAPSTRTLGLLRQRLDSVVDKPGGLEILATETIPGRGSGAVWGLDELAASEARNRDRSSSADEMVVYLQFVDGGYVEDDTVGVAYSASAAAIFSERIEEIATLLVGAEAIEAATTIHEAGHLLSLVNIGYRSPRDHVHSDGHHSSNPRSVMYWAVDNVGVVTVLGGDTEPPTDFDADDRADLEDVRTGRSS